MLGRVGAILLALSLLCCGGETPRSDGPLPIAPTPATRATPATQAADEGPLLVFLGDSLTAGYGLAEEEAFPALAARMLRERGHRFRFVNAGVSGDTSAGGLARLDWLLAQRPQLLVVCLGGNDGLRGLPLAATEANLRAVLDRARRAEVAVLLAGMQIPPNYGPTYARDFAALFPRLAKDFGVALMPFLLEGVGGVAELNLPDGIHPNERGQQLVAENLVRHLEPLVAAAAKGR